MDFYFGHRLYFPRKDLRPDPEIQKTVTRQGFLSYQMDNSKLFGFTSRRDGWFRERVLRCFSREVRVQHVLDGC